MSRLIKTAIKIGGLADILFVVFLAYKLIYYFLAGEDMLGVIFTIALGVWSISCAMAELVAYCYTKPRMDGEVK